MSDADYREALKIFAALADECHDVNGEELADDFVLSFERRDDVKGPWVSFITVADLRRARDALATLPGPSSERPAISASEIMALADNPKTYGAIWWDGKPSWDEMCAARKVLKRAREPLPGPKEQEVRAPGYYHTYRATPTPEQGDGE